MKCRIHDHNAVICASCRHRAYIFDKTAAGLMPASMSEAGVEVVCDYCGRQCVVIALVTPYCGCAKCINKRALEEAAHVRMNMPLECLCRR